MSESTCKRAAAYVTALYEKDTNPNLLYHNLGHTRNVVMRAEEIADHFHVNEASKLVICIAAWFHDVGHLFTGIENHEEKSVEMMRAYMTERTDEEEPVIKQIENCILATRAHGPATTLPEQIVCDADTYHFGTKEFKDTNKLVRKEFVLCGYDDLTKDWVNKTIEMLEQHQFHTSYCKALLDERKSKNIEWLRRKRAKKEDDNSQPGESKPIKGKGKTKENLLSRGIQTTMRLTSTNHFRLSEMADRKANILISVNSIIISVILSLLVDKLQDTPSLIVPVVLFLVSSLATIVLAILSTRPKITEGRFSREDVLNRNTNLLFFGNFYRSSLEEYQWAMSTLMTDAEYLYSVLIKDIYQIGHVLGRKYKLVRLAYTVFMLGLIISVFAFFIVMLINHGHPSEGTIITKSSGSPL